MKLDSFLLVYCEFYGREIYSRVTDAVLGLVKLFLLLNLDEGDINDLHICNKLKGLFDFRIKIS